MNKFITKIVGAALGLTLAIGVGVAVGVNHSEAREVDATIGDAVESMTDGTYFVTFTKSTKTYYLNDFSSYHFQYAELTGDMEDAESPLLLTVASSGNAGAFSVSYDNNGTETFFGWSSGTSFATSTDIPSTDAYRWTFTGTNSFTVRNKSTTARIWSDGAQNDIRPYSNPANPTTFTFYTYSGGELTPSFNVAASKLAKKNGNTPLTATITNDDSCSVHWSTSTVGASFSDSSGLNVNLILDNNIALYSGVSITATLKSKTDETLSTKNLSFIVAPDLGNSTNTALTASQANALTSSANGTGIDIYVKGFITGVDASNGKYVWIDDAKGSTQTFEVYNSTKDTFDGLEVGDYLYAHGTTKVYNTVKEIENSVIVEWQYLNLTESEVDVRVGETVDINVQYKYTTGIQWAIESGESHISISSSSDTKATISGVSGGEAVVSATLGNIKQTCTVTVSDYVFDHITLAATEEWATSYYVGDALSKTGLTVTYVEHSASLDDDRETDVTNDATFNFSSTSVGTYKLIATYNEHSTSDNVYYEVVTAPVASLVFGNASGSLAVNSSSVNGNDVNSLNWSVSVTAGATPYYAQNASYSQVGSEAKPATEITITATLSEAKTINPFVFKVGGGSSKSVATVTMKVGETTVGSGSVSGASAITINANTIVKGTTLTITISSITAGIKLYYLSYEAKTDAQVVQAFIDNYMHMTDYDPDLDNSEGDNSCEGYYALAKPAFNKMLKVQRDLFVSDSTYENAELRLRAWAAHHHESIVGETVLGTYAGILSNSNNADNSTTTLVIILIASISLVAVSSYFVIRRRREN